MSPKFPYLCFSLAMLLLGCTAKEGQSPFEPKIALEPLLSVKEEGGITGSGFTAQVFRLVGSTTDIDNATSAKMIRNGLVWRDANDHSIDAAFVFFEKFKGYSQIRPKVQEIFAASNPRAAYFNLTVFPDRVESCELWLCSSATKELVFISAKD